MTFQQLLSSIIMSYFNIILATVILSIAYSSKCNDTKLQLNKETFDLLTWLFWGDPWKRGNTFHQFCFHSKKNKKSDHFTGFKKGLEICLCQLPEVFIFFTIKEFTFKLSKISGQEIYDIDCTVGFWEGWMIFLFQRNPFNEIRFLYRKHHNTVLVRLSL